MTQTNGLVKDVCINEHVHLPTDYYCSCALYGCIAQQIRIRRLFYTTNYIAIKERTKIIYSSLIIIHLLLYSSTNQQRLKQPLWIWFLIFQSSQVGETLLRYLHIHHIQGNVGPPAAWLQFSPFWYINLAQFGAQVIIPQCRRFWYWNVQLVQKML